MKYIILKIKWMTCSACSSWLEKYLKRQKWIISANVNLVLATAEIEYEWLNIKDIEWFIADVGFQSWWEFKWIDEEKTDKKEKILLFIMWALILCLVYLWMGKMLGLWELPILNASNPILFSSVILWITIVFLVYWFDILRSGILNLWHKIPNMDTLVTLWVVFAFWFSFYWYINILQWNNEWLWSLYFETVCMILFFIKLWRYIEKISKEKTKEALQELVQITPDYAILKTENWEKEAALSEVKVNDILICKPGWKIAVDWVIIKWETHLDESFLTGESLAVNKNIWDNVIAWSINYDGYIEYQAKKIWKDSTISGIVRMVIQATSGKTKIQKIADKISGYFVPIIISIAIITFIIKLIIWDWIQDSLIHAITVLVVACPCALWLAVPLVSVVSNWIFAKKWLFIRDNEVIERSRKINTIVLDKTWTLTQWKLSVYKLFNYSKYSDKELLNIVANIEELSLHPISTAFQKNKSLEVSNFKNLSWFWLQWNIGENKYYIVNKNYLDKLKIDSNKNKSDFEELSNQWCSILYVIENNKIIWLIWVKDTVRKESISVIKEFNRKWIETIMLTWDNSTTANIIANELWIKTVISEVLPTEKADKIWELVEGWKEVMMVGDGINDAPSLVKASIWVSINDWTDVAKDSADVILTNNNLSNILDLINISQKAYIIIKQNLFWAFIYNICMIPIAIWLFEKYWISLTPVFGAIAMVISSLCVILNSIRLKFIYK